MFQIRPTITALTLSSMLALSATFANAQAVAISADLVNAVLAACVDPDSAACAAALNAVIAANPGVQPSVVVGALAAQLAAVSNDAIAAGTPINFAAISSSLSALSGFASASLGLAGLGATIAAIGSAVGAGESVDIGAIASGEGGDATPGFPIGGGGGGDDGPASPT